jgi:hypothetical protein
VVYTPNAFDLMPEDELERRTVRAHGELQSTFDQLYGHGGQAVPVGEERAVLHKRYDDLHQLTHALDAARGRRTWKRNHGSWPDFLG